MAEEHRALTLHQKLLEVQSRITYLQTTERSGGKGAYDYVSSAAVLEAIRSHMDDVGLLLQVQVLAETLHLGAAYSGNQHLTELVMEFTWINVDAPDETMVCRWYGQGIDAGEKGPGKAMSYAEKYFLLKIFHVATGGDDPDAHSGIPTDAEKTAAPKASAPTPGAARGEKPATPKASGDKIPAPVQKALAEIGIAADDQQAALERAMMAEWGELFDFDQCERGNWDDLVAWIIVEQTQQPEEDG